MQSVVRVDPRQVQDFVAGLLHDQAQGKTEELAYTPAKTTTSVVNDTDINGLAAAVSDVLTAKGFTAGAVGNNEGAHVKTQPGAGRQARRPGRAGGRQGAGWIAGRRRHVDPAGIGPGGAGQRLHRSGLRAVRRRLGHTRAP